MVSEINILIQFPWTIYYIFIINCIRFEKMHAFCDTYAMKNNLRIKMQITYFFVASKNIDFNHVRHMAWYMYFSYLCMVSKNIDFDHVRHLIRYMYFSYLYKSDYYFAKCSESALTSFAYIPKCYHL